MLGSLECLITIITVIFKSLYCSVFLLLCMNTIDVNVLSTVHPILSGAFRSLGWAWPAAAHCPSSSCPAGGVCTVPRQPASGAAASSCSRAAAGWTARLAGPERSRPRGAGNSRSGSSGP